MGFIQDTFFGGAEKKAARAQSAGIQSGIDEISANREVVNERFDPAISAGNAALAKERALLGLDGVGAQQTAFDNFRESPGQAFLRERRERALLRNSAAIGGLGGGNVRRALSEEGNNFAASQIGEFQDRLSRVSGRGLSAVGNVSSIDSNASANIANLEGAKGAARASGIVGSAAGARAGISRLAGVFL